MSHHYLYHRDIDINPFNVGDRCHFCLAYTETQRLIENNDYFKKT